MCPILTAGYRAGAGRAVAERADSVLSPAGIAGRAEVGADTAARAEDMADTAAIIADPAFGVKVESRARGFTLYCRKFARNCLRLSVSFF